MKAESRRHIPVEKTLLATAVRRGPRTSWGAGGTGSRFLRGTAWHLSLALDNDDVLFTEIKATEQQAVWGVRADTQQPTHH